MNDHVRIINDLIFLAEKNICLHESTHRGGAIWEICDECGMKWAGGVPDSARELPAEIERAYGMLRELADKVRGQPELPPDYQEEYTQLELDLGETVEFLNKLDRVENLPYKDWGKIHSPDHYKLYVDNGDKDKLVIPLRLI
jgi:hypothetical protein